MSEKIDFCSHVQMLKALQSKKMDKTNQLLDAFLVAFTVANNPNDYEEVIQEVIATNKKILSQQMTLEQKIRYYNEIINKEQKKQMVFKQLNSQKQKKSQIQLNQISQIVKSEIIIDQNRENKYQQQNPIIQKPKQQQVDCKICLESLNAMQSFQLEQCQHIYHKKCLIEYGKNWQAMPVKCPQQGCKFEILQSDLNEICDKETKIRLVNNSFKNYIARTQDIIQCPTPDCEGVFVVDVKCLQQMSSFMCSVCKVSHCTKCRRAAHQGECKQGSMIQIVDFKTFKRCNKCGMMIEKVGGCNHIKCLCKNEFCFSCGKEWINKDAFYCFCESKLQLKLASIFGLSQAEFKQPKPEAKNLEERISREIKNGVVDAFLINLIRYVGRREKSFNERQLKNQQQ